MATFSDWSFNYFEWEIPAYHTRGAATPQAKFLRGEGNLDLLLFREGDGEIILSHFAPIEILISPLKYYAHAKALLDCIVLVFAIDLNFDCLKLTLTSDADGRFFGNLQ